MKLFLVRHGIASQNIGGAVTRDSERPLTEEGEKQLRDIALGIKKLKVGPQVILASPLVRAVQTAEIIAGILEVERGVVRCDALAPGGTATDVYRSIGELGDATDVMIVGHQPDMTNLASSLLWLGPDFDMPFKKAGLCRIDVTSMPPTAPGTLRWFLTPDQAVCMAGEAG